MKHSLKIIVALGLLLSTAACGNAGSSAQHANYGSVYSTADAGTYSSRSSNDFFLQENN